MTPAWGFSAPFLPQMLGNFAARELRHASGLFTLMRNLGDAVGSTLVNTWPQDSARMLRFGEAMGAARSHAPGVLAALATRIATVMVQGELARVATRDAFTLGFNDVFRLMAWMFLAARVIVPFCRPGAPAGAPAPDVH